MWFPNNKPAPVHVVPGNKTQHNNNTTTAPRNGCGACCNHRFPHPRHRRRARGARVTAVIAWGKRPVPSRTRKLRPTAPMVLHPGGCGRVGHRRTTIRSRASNHQVGGSPTLTPHTTAPARAPVHTAAGHQPPRQLPPAIGRRKSGQGRSEHCGTGGSVLPIPADGGRASADGEIRPPKPSFPVIFPEKDRKHAEFATSSAASW